MRFYPKPFVIIAGLLFVVMSLRLSYWQWERHQEKLGYIKVLEARLDQPPVELNTLITSDQNWLTQIHRRVHVEGIYDYQHEMILRNRRHENIAGVFVLTPLKIKGTPHTVLVNRGFTPLTLSEREVRANLSRPSEAKFVGLIKAPTVRKIFAPRDPQSGAGAPWVDSWLRMDLAAMQRQIPYPLLPVTLEIMTTDETKETSAAIVRGKSERDEMFVPSERMYSMVDTKKELNPAAYPIPLFDTVIPPGRHLGYVFEWAIIALLTILICIIIQLRPPRHILHQANASLE